MRVEALLSFGTFKVSTLQRAVTWTVLKKTFCHDTPSDFTWSGEAGEATSSQLIGQTSGCMTLVSVLFQTKAYDKKPRVFPAHHHRTGTIYRRRRVSSFALLLQSVPSVFFLFVFPPRHRRAISERSCCAFMGLRPHVHSSSSDTHLKTFTVSHSFVSSHNNRRHGRPLLPNPMHRSQLVTLAKPQTLLCDMCRVPAWLPSRSPPGLSSS